MDVGDLGGNHVLVGDVVGDCPHPLPVELLGVEGHAVVEVGLVDVEVHHARIGTTDLGDVGVTEAAAHLRGAAPVLDLGLGLGVTALDDARHHSMALAGAVEVGDHLANRAARVAHAEPLGSAGRIEVEAADLLQVDENHRHVEVAHGGEHVV